MKTVPDPPVTLQPFDAALAAAWALEPPDASLPLADWIDGQAALHRCPELLEARPALEASALGVVADALADLAAGVRRHGCATPAEYAAFGHLAVPGGDLDLVAAPPGRRTAIARAVDAEGVVYLLHGTECGRLCAAAIFAAAGRAERRALDAWTPDFE